MNTFHFTHFGVHSCEQEFSFDFKSCQQDVVIIAMTFTVERIYSKIAAVDIIAWWNRRYTIFESIAVFFHLWNPIDRWVYFLNIIRGSSCGNCLWIISASDLRSWSFRFGPCWAVKKELATFIKLIKSSLFKFAPLHPPFNTIYFKWLLIR